MFEGPNELLEWEIKWIKGSQRHKKAVTEIEELADRFLPDVIVVEEKSNHRRTTRIRKLYRAIEHLAKASSIEYHKCTKREIATAVGLSGSKTRWDIAKEVSLRIQSFAHKLPSARKPWEREDPKQSLFVAAALAITYFRKVHGQDVRDPLESEE